MTRKSSFFITTAATLCLAMSPLACWAQAAGAGAGAGGAGGVGGVGGATGTGALGTGGAGTPSASEPALRGPLAPNGLSAPGGSGTVGNPQMGTTGATPGPTPTLTPDQSLGGTPVGGTPSSNAAAQGVNGNALNPLASPTTTVGSGGLVNGLAGLGSTAANQPLQVVVGAVDLAVGKTPVALGPYVGVKIHVTNNTNSPLLLDGDRAALDKGGSSLAAVTDFHVEGAADPPEPLRQIVKNAALAAVTVGANLAIEDQIVENGPVLGRFGGDERRREATAERFGKRIVWSGDSTEGVIFFPTDDVGAINGGNIKVPVCTFPGLDIRGYVTTAAGGLETPVAPTSPLTQVGAPQPKTAGTAVVKDKATTPKTRASNNPKKQWPIHPPP